MPEAAQPAFVRPAKGSAPRQVQRPQGVPVVAPPAADDDPATRVTPGQVVRPSELDGGLHRLRAAGHRVDGRIVERQQWSDGLRVGLDRLGRERGGMGVREPPGLVRHDQCDRLPAVPDVDDDRAAGGIEILAAGAVADRGAVALDGGRGIGGAPLEDPAGTGFVHPGIVTAGTVASGPVYWVRLTVEGRPLEEAELIERAQAGEVMAYEELVRRYQDVAVRTAHLIAPAADAEDAAQEAFVKAWSALARFRRGSPFRPWLLRIVANEARNRRRSSGRRQGLALRVIEGRPSDDAAPSPESAVLDQERRNSLLAAVNALRDEDREVIGARFFLDLSEAETAEALGIPRGTVKSRLSRALGRLRSGMGAVNGGGLP